MKSVITVIIMAAALIGGGIIYMNRLHSVSEELIRMNGEIEEAVKNDRFDDASYKIDELYGYLDEKEPYFEAFGDHEELDKIKMNLAELDEYIAADYKTDAAAKVKVLDFLFNHLPKNYQLKMENIL